ncbi:MAG: AbrB/MazE/SpoVT family DNA-binding domain-containing protein [Acidobacteriota bacterium]|nr:AbrB/MazE/SpoVT family DNA-binding domain-containing protein [Acidobacteriota bacterium]
MTITVKNETDLVVPPSVRRKAGIKAGDRLEIKASRGVITIVTKPDSAAQEYTPEQRRVIDRGIAQGLEDVRKGRVYGPFSAPEAARFLRAELKARARSAKLTR